jgi:hypothetical protein
MGLQPPEKVQKLQAALHAKAKGSPTYRFYALYDKVYREDILLFAYRCCKANGGAPGVDGQDFKDIEEYGLGACRTWSRAFFSPRGAPAPSRRSRVGALLDLLPS